MPRFSWFCKITLPRCCVISWKFASLAKFIYLSLQVTNISQAPCSSNKQYLLPISTAHSIQSRPLLLFLIHMKFHEQWIRRSQKCCNQHLEYQFLSECIFFFFFLYYFSLFLYFSFQVWWGCSLGCKGRGLAAMATNLRNAPMRW